MGLEQLPRQFLGGYKARSAPPLDSFFLSSPSFVSQRKIGDYCVHSVLSRRTIPLLTSVSSRASSIHLSFLVIVFSPTETLRRELVVSVFLFLVHRDFSLKESLWLVTPVSPTETTLLREPVVSISPLSFYPLIVVSKFTMSFTGNNGFGQQCGAPAHGFQNAQFNHNGTGMGPNGHGPAKNKGGRKKVSTTRLPLIFRRILNSCIGQQPTWQAAPCCS